MVDGFEWNDDRLIVRYEGKELVFKGFDHLLKVLYAGLEARRLKRQAWNKIKMERAVKDTFFELSTPKTQPGNPEEPPGEFYELLGHSTCGGQTIYIGQEPVKEGGGKMLEKFEAQRNKRETIATLEKIIKELDAGKTEVVQFDYRNEQGIEEALHLEVRFNPELNEEEI